MLRLLSTEDIKEIKEAWKYANIQEKLDMINKLDEMMEQLHRLRLSVLV